jgi:hypothetical protein
MNSGGASDDKALKDEWARMQGMGRRLQRARTIATLAGMGVVFGGFIASALLYLFWPLEKIPVVFLAGPIVVSIAIGWGVRNKLWPKGQFA